MTRIRKLASAILAVLLVMVFSQVSFSAGWTYEELVNTYLGNDGPSEKGLLIYRSERIEGLDSLEKEQDLWDYLWRVDSPRLRAEAGLKLLETMVDGNPSRWNEMTGFLGGRSLPRSLVVFQTALVTTASLLELDDEDSAWKARELAQGLFNSTKTLQVVMRANPESALTVRSELLSLGGRVWVGNRGGDTWKLDGGSSLPFGIEGLNRGMGRTSYQRALGEKMIFLDNLGQVTSGLGSYAWDLREGRIYQLRDGDRGRSSDARSAGTGGSAGPGEGPSDGGDKDDTGGGDDDGDTDGDTGGGPGNGNGNEGNPGNGGGNTGGSGPGTGNGGENNGQGGGNDNGGGGSGNEGNSGNSGGNSDGGPGNGNGNEGNPGNGGGNTGGSGPGTGNGGENNGQGGGNDNGGGGSGNDDNRSGLGDGTNPGNGGGRDNSSNDGTENPGN